MKEGKNRPKWLKGVVTGGKGGEEKPKPKESEKHPLLSDDDAFDFANLPEVIADPDQARGETSLEFLPDNDLFPDTIGDVSWDWQAAAGPPKDAAEAAEREKERELIKLYFEVSRDKPADFATSIRPEAIREYAPALKAWTVETLHTYLSSADIWARPSFTQAVFEEIQGRLMFGKGRLLPRE